MEKICINQTFQRDKIFISQGNPLQLFTQNHIKIHNKVKFRRWQSNTGFVTEFRSIYLDDIGVNRLKVPTWKPLSMLFAKVFIGWHLEGCGSSWKVNTEISCVFFSPFIRDTDSGLTPIQVVLTNSSHHRQPQAVQPDRPSVTYKRCCAVATLVYMEIITLNLTICPVPCSHSHFCAQDFVW